ncbi:helicase associated domain-containing protein [Streptomyces sp. NPDC056529]|uniref:helicase associated domain-containing protein n=1 Tax=Streptomyces sp. NPDC056529 TaxID=3345855 RepID=UPI0036900BCA
MSRAERWVMHYTTVHQYYQREGHLTVPRKHVETVLLGNDEDEGQERRKVSFKLGARVGDQRSRAVSLTPERIEQLSRIGMRRA